MVFVVINVPNAIRLKANKKSRKSKIPREKTINVDGYAFYVFTSVAIEISLFNASK